MLTTDRFCKKVGLNSTKIRLLRKKKNVFFACHVEVLLTFAIFSISTAETAC